MMSDTPICRCGGTVCGNWWCREPDNDGPPPGHPRFEVSSTFTNTEMVGVVEVVGRGEYVVRERSSVPAKLRRSVRRAPRRKKCQAHKVIGCSHPCCR